jgi:beta-lactam-binding protein with PASTA domain
VGRTEAAADSALRVLRIERVVKRDTLVPGASPNTVVRQQPLPRIPVVRPVEVILWVARSPVLPPPSRSPQLPDRPSFDPQVPRPIVDTVPDVRGWRVAPAQELMISIGVNVAVDYVASDRPAGIVVRQMPDPGTPVEPGMPGRLFVSGGPPGPDPSRGIEVPPVVGRPRDVALELFGQVGLPVVSVQEVPVDRSRDGLVVEQAPPAGRVVEPGTPGQLWVGVFRQAPSVPTTPLVMGRPLQVALDMFREAGIEVRGVGEVVTDRSAPGTVVGQLPEPGAPAPRGTTGRLDVAVAPPLPRAPDVVGLDVREGARRFADATIEVEGYERVPSDEPEGTVLRQLPQAGAEIGPGTTGRLWVAVARPVARVPDVVGLDVDRGIRVLAQAGVAVDRVDSVASPERPGTILSQRPEPGSPVEEEVSGALEVAVEEPLPETPDVVGLFEGEAIARMAEAGVEVQRVDPVSSDEAAGRVIDQLPTAGTPVTPGTSGALWIADGVRRTDVPDVVGRPLDGAQDTLADRGLAGTVVGEVASDEPAGTVLRQFPAAGSRVDVGAGVDLEVSSGPPPPEALEVPSVVGFTLGGARGALGAAGFALGAVDSVESRTPEGTVIDQSPPAGAEALPGALVRVRLSTGPPSAPPPVEVPDLGELAWDEAEGALEERGLVALSEGDLTADARVADQFPTPGTVVPVGTSVRVTLQAASTPGLPPWWPAGAAPVALLGLLLILRVGSLRRGRRRIRLPAERSSPQLRGPSAGPASPPEPAPAAPTLDYRARMGLSSGSVDARRPLLPAIDVGLRARPGPLRVRLEVAAGRPLIPAP